MNRFVRMTLMLSAVALLAPALAQAQQEQVSEAESLIARAMLAQQQNNLEQSASFYRQALMPIRAGLAANPNHAELFLLLGQTQAALQNLESADEALRRALELEPDYEVEIEGIREGAWIVAFSSAIDALNEERFEDALRELETANVIYDRRPEGYMNLASLYVHFGRYPDAARAYARAIEAIDGPLAAELDDEQRAEWARFRELATANRSLLLAQIGYEHFEAEDFAAAAESFRAATEINRYSRDFLFNLAQALYAQSVELHEQFQAGAPGVASELRQVYDDLEATLTLLADLDPANIAINQLLARAHRGRLDLAPESEAEQWQQRALQALEAHSAMQVALDNIQAVRDEAGGLTVSGMLYNLAVEPGARFEIELALLSIRGATLGSETVTVTAPAVEEAVEFSTPVTLSRDAEIAGYRYRVRAR